MLITFIKYYTYSPLINKNIYIYSINIYFMLKSDRRAFLFLAFAASFFIVRFLFSLLFNI